MKLFRKNNSPKIATSTTVERETYKYVLDCEAGKRLSQVIGDFFRLDPTDGIVSFMSYIDRGLVAEIEVIKDISDNGIQKVKGE